ncbi:hydroxyacylglutathione hydrolase [Aerococcaceae bacterium WGS1372]
MKIIPIKAFSDNYIWLIQEGSQAVVVDPGESQKVLAYLKDNDLTLTTLLLTHNHDDHVAGVKDLLEVYPDVTVYGPQETAELSNQIVADGDRFELMGESVQIVKSEGHTRGHISYIMGNMLFCGDALFSAGCGRVFTGDYQAQYDALQTFKALDDNVVVYAAHEYTQTNLRFALSVEPNNVILQEALAEVGKMLEAGKPSLPTTIGREKKINLFLQAEDLGEFIELRQGRDQF